MIDQNLTAACKDARTVAQIIDEKVSVATIIGRNVVFTPDFLRSMAQAMRSLSAAVEASEERRDEYAILTAKLAITQTLDVPLGELVGLWTRFQLARVGKTK